jgi:FixJ family two-component response regulator
MHYDRPIVLFETDQPVLSSLQFALALQGFTPADGSAAGTHVRTARCLVIDQRYHADGLKFLQELRACGIGAPAILMATNPSARLRRSAAARGVLIIEKPLLGDELTDALRATLAASKAA